MPRQVAANPRLQGSQPGKVGNRRLPSFEGPAGWRDLHYGRFADDATGGVASGCSPTVVDDRSQCGCRCCVAAGHRVGVAVECRGHAAVVEASSDDCERDASGEHLGTVVGGSVVVAMVVVATVVVAVSVAIGSVDFVASWRGPTIAPTMSMRMKTPPTTPTIDQMMILVLFGFGGAGGCQGCCEVGSEYGCGYCCVGSEGYCGGYCCMVVAPSLLARSSRAYPGIEVWASGGPASPANRRIGQST